MMAPLETEPPPPSPSPKSRRRNGAFIALFVAAQFVIPLTYLVREDPSDDRFTWRHFAPPETPSCETRASLQRFGESEEEISLDRLLHSDWVHYVQRGRRAVVDAFLLRQCKNEDVERVELVNQCGAESLTRSYVLRCGGERPHETTRTAAR